ncbi:MAG: diguanylate cyclase, partial [Lachnospiraceae bacterium]|nr:diguanylate cyclase [Lachnospiraceae bacterium]
LNCQSVAAEINEALASTEQSVRFMSQYISTLSLSFEDLTSDEAIFKEYNRNIITIFDKVTHDTVGAVTYYFRYNPDYFPPDAGFLYSKEYSHEYLGKDFVELEPTDLSLYAEDDPAVEWFYAPLRSGVGEWISPYWGDNLQMNMISYVMPVSVGDTIIGVIGMDIDFDILIENISTKKFYDSGHSFLIGTDGGVLDKDSVRHATSSKIAIEEVDKFRKNLTEKESMDLIAYTYNGIHKRMVYSRLNNNMYLVFVADDSDIYEEQHFLLNLVIFIAIIIAFICAFAGFQTTKRLTDPLEQLTLAAAELADGKFNVVIPTTHNDDEVGKLAKAFQKTVDHLQQYITYVQDLAYKDALTGVQNRAAYEKSMEQIDIDIRLGRAEFALIMVDLNKLKTINDTYGHEMGNRYIQNLCAKIKNIFPMESVYRIGGDEFIIILRDEQYQDREGSLDQIREVLAFKDAVDTEHLWENVSAAAGMAVFDPAADDSTESVFKRADQAMYENKIKMKEKFHR